LKLSGFEYQSSEEVREELRKLCAENLVSAYKGSHRVAPGPAVGEVLDLSMYHVDALVRRAPSLQKTREGRTLAVAY